MRRLGWGLLVLGVFAAICAGAAEYYTARPAFCGSCHIMDPYYRSWARDVHGAKLGARCVDCHYAPGEQHTLKAKFKGLSQVTSYFSGRAGASRPRAHVDNASCLTARCHGDNVYMAKPLLIGEPRPEKRVIGAHETEVTRLPTVTFVHAKHLEVHARLTETEARLAELRQRLQQAAPPAAYERLSAVAVAMRPVAQRVTELGAALRELHLEALGSDAEELMRLEHLRTRLQQLAGLNCSACHSYDASGEHHLLPADLQTCFTCHFNNQRFNQDTGACLKCHAAPVRKILIHDEPVRVQWQQQYGPANAATEPVLMDHRDIVARGVECGSCHLDVIQGQAVVTARDCSHCHDQQHYLEGFEERDTARVAEYHRLHVAAQRAHCFDCHRSIQHRLIDPTHIGTDSGFLRPVLDDCQHCHPNHHAEQVALLMGVGGDPAIRPMPNAMFGSRLNCSACHTKASTDLKGDELIKASAATCIACHGRDYEQLFEQWRSEIRTSSDEAEASLRRVEDRLTELQAAGRPVPAGVADLVERARRNIHFLKAGNGIHNKNYALALLDESTRALDQAMGLLTGP